MVLVFCETRRFSCRNVQFEGVKPGSVCEELLWHYETVYCALCFGGPLPRLDYENELLFGLLAGVSCQLIVAGPENRLTVSCWNGMGWEGRSQSQSSLGLEWRFRQTLSFSLNKRQLTSFSFLAFMHCVRLMCVSVCQAKPSHPIHLGIGIVHFPKTNNPHSYNNNNNMAFLLMMTHALSYAQSQLWLRFFFLRASLSLSSSLDCVLGKCKLWLPWSAYCMPRYTMRCTIYHIRYLRIDSYFSLSFGLL